MKTYYKVYYYIAMVSLAIGFGAFFYVFFLLYRNIIFPILVSMKLHYLEKKNLAVLRKATAITKGYIIQGVHTEDEETYLENVFFITKEFMQETYKRFLFIKLLLYSGILLFGLWNIRYFESDLYIFYFIEMYFILIVIWGIKIVYVLYRKIKYEEYEIKKVVINGKNHYTGYLEIKNKKGEKVINLMNAIM